MRYHFVALLASIIFALAPAAVVFSVIPDAEATRPVPGYKYKDVCKNIPGKQPIYETVGSGPYRFDESTKRPNDCYRWNVKKG